MENKMKKFTVRYAIGVYWYQSEVFTDSSNAAILWAEKIGGYNVSVVSEAIVWKEKELDP
jgi:hypothetical protein